VRSGNPGALTAELLGLVADHQDEWRNNYRDLMVALAPYHDCARRLGVVPGEIFDTVAAGAPPSLSDLVRAFGRRTEVRPDGFGFAVVETSEGPEYISTL